jgi:hypothetical protein
MSALDTVEARILAAVEETDGDGVLTWRYESLRRAGYAPNDAAGLARRRGVDLHQAVELLEGGCDPRLALRILL